jgi:hypothetical protein
MVSFTPVVMRTIVETRPEWPVLGEEPPYLVRLTAEATDEEVGSLVWQLAQYNGIPVEDRMPADLIQAIATAPSIVLPGGVAVRDDTGREIVPGCCAGLEEWREWLAFELTGQTPWMGHEPDPWLEHAGDYIRVWSHGELSEGAKSSPYAVEVSLEEFRRALAGLQHDLGGFLRALRAWAERHAPEQADSLVARFDEAFEITAGQDRDAVT